MCAKYKIYFTKSVQNTFLKLIFTIYCEQNTFLKLIFTIYCLQNTKYNKIKFVGVKDDLLCAKAIFPFWNWTKIFESNSKTFLSQKCFNGKLNINGKKKHFLSNFRLS